MTSISKTRKKRGRGRPKIGATPVQVRIPPHELAALDQWIAEQKRELTRPQALRYLMHQALVRQRRRDRM